MDSTKYHRLEELPEPDYFEIELEKVYEPPPTRTSRVKRWVRHNLLLVTFLTLFLVAAVLYMSAKTAIEPMLTGLLRTDNTQLKQATRLGGSQAQTGLSSSDPNHTDGEGITPHVAGSEEGGVKGNQTTNVIVSPADSKDSGDSKKPIEIHKDPDQGTSKGNSSGTEAVPSQNLTQTAGIAAVQKPTQRPVIRPSNTPAVPQDNEQVSMKDPTPEDKEPFVPIRATFFSGSEGPKSCRGHAIALISLPKTQGLSVPTAKQCYNFPGQQSSGCALFMANKIDRCQASLYAETNCGTYMNTMAFMPEERPVGGLWRSVSVQCGLPEPDPASLGQPPMLDQMTSIVDHDKGKGG